MAYEIAGERAEHPEKRPVAIETDASDLRTPRVVRVRGKSYILTRDAGEWRLLSTSCPHLGGTVRIEGAVLRCPHHGWEFDCISGRANGKRDRALQMFAVEERDGALYADIPMRSESSARPRRLSGALPADFSVSVLSHSCLKLERSGFSLLTDPWIWGTAFLGAWMPYPAPTPSAEDVLSDAIWISHEHSDHLHLETLKRLDRRTPVYFPAFPNGRIDRLLETVGFTDRVPVHFGQRVEVSKQVAITCFEPKSAWNDSITLFELDGVNVLNLNDAGLNPAIADLLPEVDVLCSAFRAGASGFPLTWKHLDDDAKLSILRRASVGQLTMLTEAVEMYRARMLLPYAGHFTLHRREHRGFAQRLAESTATIFDVADHFRKERPGLEVLTLLPGETWTPATGSTNLRADRHKLYEPVEMWTAVDRWSAEQEANDSAATEFEISDGDIVNYFERLNRSPEIAFCEDLSVSLEILGTPRAFQIAIAGGRLTIQPGPAPTTPQITMSVPEWILARVIADDLSWDEAHIGYWCEFSRSPDEFHPGFWRLLQCPYYARGSVHPEVRSVRLRSSIAKILEEYGPLGERVLSRHGLYCVGCDRSEQEDLLSGALKHGLSLEQANQLAAELNSIANRD